MIILSKKSQITLPPQQKPLQQTKNNPKTNRKKRLIQKISHHHRFCAVIKPHRKWTVLKLRMLLENSNSTIRDS